MSLTFSQSIFWTDSLWSWQKEHAWTIVFVEIDEEHDHACDDLEINKRYESVITVE